MSEYFCNRKWCFICLWRPFLIGFLFGIYCLLITVATVQRDWRQAAVRHGAAHWAVHLDGSTDFEWNDQQ